MWSLILPVEWVECRWHRPRGSGSCPRRYLVQLSGKGLGGMHEALGAIFVPKSKISVNVNPRDPFTSGSLKHLFFLLKTLRGRGSRVTVIPVDLVT